MRAPTVILSAVIHVGLAAGLIATAQNREHKRRAISVAVSEEKKRAKPKPPPPPPPPPPVVHHAAPKVVASLAKAETVAPAKAAAPAPMAMGLTMSNDDVGPGIALGGGRETAAAEKSAPKAVKVASAIPERRTRNTQQQLEGGAPGEPACTEAPTDPVPAVTSEINYSLYPQAQQEGIEGKFKARIVVGANGEVTDVEVLTSLEPGFDAAIKAALMRWRFKPAMQCGRPVAGGIHKFTARFELAD